MTIVTQGANGKKRERDKKKEGWGESLAGERIIGRQPEMPAGRSREALVIPSTCAPKHTSVFRDKALL